MPHREYMLWEPIWDGEVWELCGNQVGGVPRQVLCKVLCHPNFAKVVVSLGSKHQGSPKPLERRGHHAPLVLEFEQGVLECMTKTPQGLCVNMWL